jgi:hypothetical protein
MKKIPKYNILILILITALKKVSVHVHRGQWYKIHPVYILITKLECLPTYLKKPSLILSG